MDAEKPTWIERRIKRRERNAEAIRQRLDAKYPGVYTVRIRRTGIEIRKVKDRD